jgi:hypothetical protein
VSRPLQRMATYFAAFKALWSAVLAPVFAPVHIQLSYPRARLVFHCCCHHLQFYFWSALAHIETTYPTCVAATCHLYIFLR